MSYKSLLWNAATAFERDVESLGPIRQATYAAVACGGGEIGLYTLLGGYFRNELERHNPQHLLWINGGCGKTKIRPDFQVLENGKLNTPQAVVEFKFLADYGIKEAAPEAGWIMLRGEHAKLQKVSLEYPEAELLLGVFVWTKGDTLSNVLKNAKEELNLDSLGSAKLWTPLGLEPTGHLHFLLGSVNISNVITSIGDDVPLEGSTL